MKAIRYISPDGSIYSVLPKMWRNVTPFTEDYALSHGWTKEEYDVPPESEPPRQYSKYALKRALEKRGLWETIKQAIIDAGMWEDFSLAQDLAEDDEKFSTFLTSMRQQYGEVAEEVLAEAEI